MRKTVICLLMCFVWYAYAAAQPTAANRLLNNIIKLTNALIKDSSVTNPCKKNIQEFGNHLPAPNKLPADNQSIQRLIQVSTLFTNSFTNTPATNCVNGSIIKLLDSTHVFIALLQDLGKPAISAKVVNITFTNQYTDGMAYWKLSIDSLRDAIGNNISEIAIKDSMGVLEVQLLNNNNNEIKTTVNDSNITVSQEQGALAIRLPKQKINIASSAYLHGSATQQLKTLQNQNTILLISVILLFLLTLTITWLYARVYKKFRLLPAIPSSDDQLNTVEAVELTQKDISPIADSYTDVEETPAEPETLLASPDVIAGTDPYFVCELMMTSGPRKKPMSEPNSDIDLGEDVCGFISNANSVFVWLLDGTSDDDPLRNPLDNREYFSARLLAQSIGDRLRNLFTYTPHSSLTDMMHQAIEEVKTNWLQHINALPEEEKNNLKSKITNKIFPHCSATALVAQLQKNGTLTAYRVGDSKMLLFGRSTAGEWSSIETSLTDKNENGVDRIFFRLGLNDEAAFNIVSNTKPEYDTAEVSHVDTLICFSDGIGLETEQTLKEDYVADPVKAKKEIVYEVQGTMDDKSICFIELKKKEHITNI